MSNFHNLCESTLEDFNSTIDGKSFLSNVKFMFVGSDKQKKVIEITKLNDRMSFITKADLLVSINEQLMNEYDEISWRILFEQEIDKISINMETGAIKFLAPIKTYASVVDKYGFEAVKRANDVQALTNEQKADMESGFIG